MIINCNYFIGNIHQNGQTNRMKFRTLHRKSAPFTPFPPCSCANPPFLLMCKPPFLLMCKPPFLLMCICPTHLEYRYQPTSSVTCHKTELPQHNTRVLICTICYLIPFPATRLLFSAISALDIATRSCKPAGPHVSDSGRESCSFIQRPHLRARGPAYAAVRVAEKGSKNPFCEQNAPKFSLTPLISTRLSNVCSRRTFYRRRKNTTMSREGEREDTLSAHSGEHLRIPRGGPYPLIGRDQNNPFTTFSLDIQSA